MPLTGTRDITPLLGEAPLVASLDTDTWALPGASVLQVMYEIDDNEMTSLLPPALHPTIPPTVLFVFTQAPESSVGPFTLAEVRIGCRSAMRPRSFLARAYCDSPGAIRELSERWGYAVEQADVQMHKHYDRVWGTVVLDGRTILDCSLMNPEAISGGDVQYLPNVNLARVRRNGSEEPRLIQVDPEFTFRKADRGRPRLDGFEAGAWLLEGCRPNYPVSASSTVCDITLPKLRYLADPRKRPMEAVEKV